MDLTLGLFPREGIIYAGGFGAYFTLGINQFGLYRVQVAHMVADTGSYGDCALCGQDGSAIA